MTEPTNRRWPRFSLRTLFVVVTAFGWLGYELNWIRQRRELISYRNVEALVWAKSPPTYPPAPGLLGLFGEKGRDQIKIVVDLPLAPEDKVPLDRRRTADEQALLERARALFPEAEVTEVSLEYMRAIKRRP